LAALHGHLAVVEYLLKYEVEVDIRDMLGFSALDYALHADNTPCIELLKTKCQSSNGQNNICIEN
jgi:ankyrin repeat protein